MIKEQETGIDKQEKTLTPQQLSWLNYWDKWYFSALQAGDMQGGMFFLINTIKVLKGIDVPKIMAPATPSISMSFVNINDYKTHFYSW